MKIINQEMETVPVHLLHPHKDNPREGDLGAIGESIAHNGFYGAIIVQKGTNTILAGAHRWRAASQAGAREIPVIYVEADDDQARRILLADNRANDLASQNPAKLAALLQDLDDLSGTLYDTDALDALLSDLDGEAKREGDPEATPQIPEEVTSQAGDIWILGAHRLAVGDCTDAGLLSRIFGTERAAITLTSPPYNVAKDSGLPNHEKYLVPDERSDSAWLDLLERFTALALERSEYVFVNLQSVAGNKLALIDYLARCRDVYADTLIWDKMSAEPAMNKRCLNSRFEYVHIFSHAASRAIGTAEFHGTLDNVLPLSSHTDKDHAGIHKATYPVAFADHFVQNFCLPGEIVFDPFVGTGTTLISAERNGRRCYCVEIVPAYADVVLQRVKDLTGIEPKREESA